MQERVTVGHRFGHVFLRVIKSYSNCVTARLTPETADAIADELRHCAARARKEPVKGRKLKLARG